MQALLSLPESCTSRRQSSYLTAAAVVACTSMGSLRDREAELFTDNASAEGEGQRERNGQNDFFHGMLFHRKVSLESGIEKW